MSGAIALLAGIGVVSILIVAIVAVMSVTVAVRRRHRHGWTELLGRRLHRRVSIGDEVLSQVDEVLVRCASEGASRRGRIVLRSGCGKVKTMLVPVGGSSTLDLDSASARDVQDWLGGFEDGKARMRASDWLGREKLDGLVMLRDPKVCGELENYGTGQFWCALGRGHTGGHSPVRDRSATPERA